MGKIDGLDTYVLELKALLKQQKSVETYIENCQCLDVFKLEQVRSFPQALH